MIVYDIFLKSFSLLTLPTYLTLVRMALIPWIVISMRAHSWGIALFLFIGAVLTDIIDGPLARYLNQVSVVGAFLDPCADKLLLISCYLSLFLVKALPLWFLLFALLSELLFVFTALYLVFIKKSQRIEPSILGKLSGLPQVLLIGWFFICRIVDIPLNPLFSCLLVLAVGVRLYAFVDYGIRLYYKNAKCNP